MEVGNNNELNLSDENKYVCCASSLFMACGTPKDGYVVKGSLKNAGDGYAVISVADHTGASVIADTAEMSGESFVSRVRRLSWRRVLCEWYRKGKKCWICLSCWRIVRSSAR